MTRAVSALGDSALLLPVSLALLCYLTATGRGRLALAFATSLGACGAATVLGKLAFHACGTAITDLDVVSPSGHASFAAVFYGALAAMLATGRPAATRVGLAAGAALVVLAVGASRVRMDAHTAAEVVIGLAIGTAALGLFLVLRRGASRQPLPAWPIATGFALALLLLGGRHFSLEGPIGRLARQLSAAVDVCGPS